MLIPTEQADVFQAGPADIICILQNTETGRFHPAFFEEHPPPGPIRPIKEMEALRLKSKMHHTIGFESLAEAQENVVEDLRTRILLPDANVCLDPIALAFGGIPARVWWVSNWVADGQAFDAAMIA